MAGSKTDLSDIGTNITDAILQVLNDDVVPYVDELIDRYIKSEIYGKSKLKQNAWVEGETYARRYELLHAPTYVRPYRLAMEPMAGVEITRTGRPSPSILGDVLGRWGAEPGWFLDMLAEGDLGFYDHDFPRPVIPLVQAYVDSDPKIERMIEKGLSAILK